MVPVIFKLCLLHVVHITYNNSPITIATEEDSLNGGKTLFYRGSGLSKVAAYTLSLAGSKAWMTLLRGSRRVTPRFANIQEYQKSGDFDAAVKQFLNQNPSNVKTHELADGVTSVTGRIGDRLFVVKKIKPGEERKAVIQMKVDKTNYEQKREKIIYMGNKRIKPNVWW